MNLRRAAREVSETALDIFFPKKCFGCSTMLTRSETHILCERCFRALSIQTLFYCPDCKKRLTECTRLCGCGARFIGAAPCFYGALPLTEIVQALKYKGIRAGAVTLGSILAHWAKQSAFDPASVTVVPIPLSKRRLRERGFNQAELIAHHFVASLDVPPLSINTALLARIRHTTPQTELHSYEERAKNVADAFRAGQPELIKGTTILLIDDVMTSGSTMREAAKVLRANGARRVIGLTVLRA